MTLEQFAKSAGVTLIEGEPDWGGKVAYKTKDHHNTVIAGFRTAGAAYKHWLKSTFGEHTAKAVMKLLKHSNDAANRLAATPKQQENVNHD